MEGPALNRGDCTPPNNRGWLGAYAPALPPQYQRQLLQLPAIFCLRPSFSYQLSRAHWYHHQARL